MHPVDEDRRDGRAARGRGCMEWRALFQRPITKVCCKEIRTKGIDNKSNGTTRLWPSDNFLRSFLFTRRNSLFSPAAPRFARWIRAERRKGGRASKSTGWALWEFPSILSRYRCRFSARECLPDLVPMNFCSSCSAAEFYLCNRRQGFCINSAKRNGYETKGWTDDTYRRDRQTCI